MSNMSCTHPGLLLLSVCTDASDAQPPRLHAYGETIHSRWFYLVFWFALIDTYMYSLCRSINGNQMSKSLKYAYFYSNYLRFIFRREHLTGKMTVGKMSLLLVSSSSLVMEFKEVIYLSFLLNFNYFHSVSVWMVYLWAAISRKFIRINGVKAHGLSTKAAHKQFTGTGC